MDARYDPRHAGQACCRAYRHNRRVRRVAQARYVSRKKRNRSVIMGQEWRDPGVLRLHRDFVQSQMCSLAERASEIARSLSQAAKPKIEAAARGKARSSHESGLASQCIGSEAGMWHCTSFSLRCTKLT